MTEDEFRAELQNKKNVFIISTSAPDKVKEYGELFAGLEINGFFTGSGALNMVASKTPEMNGHYMGNIGEKQRAQLATLIENDKVIRGRLSANVSDSQNLNVIGMTEDSGCHIFPKETHKTTAFIKELKNQVKKELGKEDQWLVDGLKDNDFPGANLKPIQEHLMGGIDRLMHITYDVADKLGVRELRYINTAHVSFTFPECYQKNEKAIFSIKAEAGGKLLNRKEYRQHVQNIDALNYDAVQIPDGQAQGEQKTLYVLKRLGLFSNAKEAPEASHYKTDIMKYLSHQVGTEGIQGDNTDRRANIGWVSPDTPITHKDPIADYDAVVLRANKLHKKDGELYSDENLRLVLQFATLAIINPQQKYIILDNRDADENGKRPFDDIIQIFINSSIKEYRAFGEQPFLVANTDSELEKHLKFVKRVTQRAPKIGNHIETKPFDPLSIDMVPADGRFTVFIAGGHNNNSKRDQEEAKKLGYMCAQNGFRIITGAGCIEGSMGAIHTGFIQYHLDRIVSEQEDLPEFLRRNLDIKEYKTEDGRYNAEALITANPALIDKLADKGFIPRDMFYGYSMKNLLKLESVSGEAPPGITYFESGSLANRIYHCLQAGTKIIMPGGPGTDEEFAEAIHAHLEARKAANNYAAFSDGTAKDDGHIIVYNRDHIFDTILMHFNLIDNKGRSTKAARDNHVIVINSSKKLQEATGDRAKNWQGAVANPSISTTTKRA